MQYRALFLLTFWCLYPFRIFAVEGNTRPLSPRNASYTIKVTLHPESRTLEGHVVLTWRNIQSKPTKELWFHLYYNAWRNPDSTWMRERSIQRPPRELREVPPDEWSAIDVLDMVLRKHPRLDAPVSLSDKMRFVSPDDGNPHDRTVLVVNLPETVEPGESIEVEYHFKARVPRTFARTGFRGPYFFIAQWFPKLGVFEPEGVWNCHQFHASTEFYSDYGVYDVTITVPANYVVGATGVQQSRIINKDGTVSYRFVQADVHDFAWVASPNLIEVKDRFEHPKLPPVDIRLLLQPEHRRQAQRMIHATKAALEKYGTWYGPYPYGHITVVDPAYGSRTGGMEYPTLFTAGTRYWNPFGGGSPEGVTVHEAGHQFWYGIVGNNEFEYAWLDEGLNTFSTGRVMFETYGPTHYMVRYFRGFVPYLFRGIQSERVNYRRSSYRRGARSDIQATPSYRYFPETGRIITYSKTAVWLYTLEKYLGWDVLQKGMSLFFHRYAFKHPKPEDFIQALEEASGQSLDWFFRPVLYSNATFDYEVWIASSYPVPSFKEVPIDPKENRSDKNPNKEEHEEKQTIYRSFVVVRRNGDGVLPVTVEIVFEDGQRFREYWDGRDPWKMFQYERPARLEYAVVDPDEKLALDLNFTNNSRTVRPQGHFPSTKWATRWMVWFQHILMNLTGLT